MGAVVWKRDSGGSAQGAGQARAQEAVVQQQNSAAGQHEADANRPHKKQRLGEEDAASVPGNQRTPHSHAHPQQHRQAVDRTAAASFSKPRPGGASTQQQLDGVAAEQQHPLPPSNRGRGRARGAFPGRSPSGRHPAEAGRGSHHKAAAGPHPPAGAAAVGTAVQQQQQQQQGSPGKGALQFDARGRGAGRMVSMGRGVGRSGGAYPHFHAQQQQAASNTAAAQQQQQAAAQEALLKKQQEMEALKAKIREQQAKKDALKAAQELKQHQESQQQKLQQRKKGLNSAFGSAFANAAKAKQEQAKQQAATAAAAVRPTAAAADADAAEVQRVLASRNDYEVLQLKPGCDAAALKKRYRELAVRLHPDKCNAEHAKDAFQRANKAYQVLKDHVL